MDLDDLLTTRDVVFGIRTADIGAAAAQLLSGTLPQRGYAPADVERIVQHVLERERQSPTLCGPIAIPHAHDEKLQRFVAAVGINREGLITGSPSPQIVITFVSPEAERSQHLALLSSLARLSRDQEAVSAIAGAGDPQTVIDVVRRHRT